MNLNDFRPGRDLDGWVADAVMGDSVLITDIPLEDTGTFAYKEVPHYSTDIAAATTVLSKLIEDGKIVTFSLYYGGIAWEATFWFEDKPILEVEADTAPHAICLAALHYVNHF